VTCNYFLPIFPREATLLNANVGVYEREGIVQYLETVLILCHIRFMMDFLAKRGRFCRHSLSHVEKSNEVAAKKTHKDMKGKNQNNFLINGLPVYSHARDDNDALRFIISNLISQGLYRKVDIERAFGVSEDSFSRAYNKYLKKGKLVFLDHMPDMGRHIR